MSFIFLGVVSLIIGSVWAINGVWVILPFVLLEIFALLVAFFIYSSHATDSEKITLTEDQIFFESDSGGMKKSDKFPRYLVRTNFERNTEEGLVSFSWGSKKIYVGKFVDLKSRERFYGEIRGYL